MNWVDEDERSVIENPDCVFWAINIILVFAHLWGHTVAFSYFITHAYHE